MTNLISLVDSIVKPTTARVVYITQVEVLKKSRVDKIPTPTHLQGLQSITDGVMNLGHDYTTAVENQLTKSIQKDYPILSKTEAKTAAGHIWQTDEHPWAEVDPNYASGSIYRNKNPQKRQEEMQEFGEYKKYVKIFKDMSSKLKNVGLFDASFNLVNVTWAEQIAFFSKNPEKAGSEKQKEAGLEKEVKFRLITVTNVKYLRCGEKEYDFLNPTEKNLRELIK